MLNKGERYEILKVFRTCFKFGCLPGQVELSSWELIPLANRKKIWTRRLYFALFLLHAIYKMGSFAYFLHAGTLPLHEMIIHFILAASGATCIIWYYILFVQYPVVFALFFRMTLTGEIGEEDVSERKARSWFRRLQEFSPQDWCAMCMPFMVRSFVVTTLVTLIFYPSMKLMLYNAVPKELETWPTFGVLLLEELRFVLVLGSLATLVWILQVISFDLINNRLELLINSMERMAPSYRHVYKSLRCMQLYMINVNLINRFVIYFWKVLCLMTCISSGYAAIAHFSDLPVFGVMYYIMLLNAGVTYICSYDKAFQIPALFDNARRTALLRVRNQKSKGSRIFKMQVRSIPRMGIQVGTFHTMERQSTLAFIHFVLNNIVSLLVAKRHG